jgi:hypothetical protein
LLCSTIYYSTKIGAYFTGIPGARSDTYLFDRSAIPVKFLKGELGGGKDIGIYGVRIPEHVLADSGFSPKTYCICPFDMRKG